MCAKRPFVAFKSVDFVVSFHLHSKIGILKVIICTPRRVDRPTVEKSQR